MIFQPVIVADPLNPVVVNVQPFKALWDEGKVEPLRTIKSEMMKFGDKRTEIVVETRMRDKRTDFLFKPGGYLWRR